MSATDAEPVQSAQRQGERAVQAAPFEWLARAGLLARGVVYGVVGVLALKLALGDAGGKATDQQGALKEIAGQASGKVLLALVAVGLAGYAVWRLVRGVVGHGPEQRQDAKDRVSDVVAGVTYGALCVTAVKIVTGAHAGSGTPEQATGGVLGWTGGPVIVTVTGLVLLGIAVYQLHKGVTRGFLDDTKTGEMGESVQRAFTALGVFGHVARGVVFALIGYGLVKAALDYDPRNAVGLDGALRKLADASYGPWLLGLVAVGLVGFAVYSVACARFRRV